MSVKTAKRATATKSSVELLPGWHDIYNGGKDGRKPDDFETKSAQGLSCVFFRAYETVDTAYALVDSARASAPACLVIPKTSTSRSVKSSSQQINRCHGNEQNSPMTLQESFVS